jgi:hypothetical protein
MANVFYVEEMNATSNATAAATFGTSATALPTVNYSNVSIIDAGTAAQASAVFSFYLDIASTVPRLMGVTNTAGASFLNLVTSSASNSTSAVDKANITDDYIDLSAIQIFGSTGGRALFTNLGSLKTGYETALTAVGTAVNSTLAANSTTLAAAGDKLIQQISANYIDRFALMYNAASIPASAAAYNGQSSAAWYPNGTTQATSIVVYRGAGAGTLESYDESFTTATVSVKTSDASGTIESIFITTNASQWTSNTGSGYEAGDKLAIVAANTGVCVVKIDGINTVQAAILNGTLDNSILYNMTKSGVLFLTSFGTGSLSGTSFISSNNIASTALTGGLSNAGAGATFDVVMSSSSSVASIKINTTGSSYVVDNNIILTYLDSTITIVLTSAMVSVINGSDSAGYGTFPVPSSGGNFLFTPGAALVGSGHIDGTYTTTGVSGGASQGGVGATFTVDITGSAITSIVLLAKATTNYVLGNILTISITVSDVAKTITLAALTNKSLDIINNGLDGTTYSIPVVTTGSTNGAGAYVDVTMRDSSYIETIANSTYNYDFGVGASAASAPVSGAYTVSGVTGGSPTDGAGATFNVIMSGIIIAGIRRFGVNPTQAYVVGNILTLTGSGGTITLAALTAATAAILNGATTAYDTSSTLTISAGTAPIKLMNLSIAAIAAADTDDGTKAVSILNGTANALSASAQPVSAALITRTNVPLESGDKIRMKQAVGSATGQKNTLNEDISYEQSAFIDYLCS